MDSVCKWFRRRRRKSAFTKLPEQEITGDPGICQKFWRMIRKYIQIDAECQPFIIVIGGNVMTEIRADIHGMQAVISGAEIHSITVIHFPAHAPGSAIVNFRICFSGSCGSVSVSDLSVRKKVRFRHKRRQVSIRLPS